jgi:hypothetical protein
MEMVKHLSQLTPPRTPTIACLAPYNSHVGKLESAFEVLKAKNPDLTFDVEFGSIDGFQGRDKEFVIISFPNTAAAGFTANDGRFVSSVTRHKNGMVLIADCTAVGHMEKRERNPFLSFIENTRSYKGIFELEKVGDFSPSARMTLDETPEEEPTEQYQPGADNNWNGDQDGWATNGNGRGGDENTQQSFGQGGEDFGGQNDQEGFPPVRGESGHQTSFAQQDGFTEQGGDFTQEIDPNDPYSSTLVSRASIVLLHC